MTAPIGIYVNDRRSKRYLTLTPHAHGGWPTDPVILAAMDECHRACMEVYAQCFPNDGPRSQEQLDNFNELTKAAREKRNAIVERR